MTKIEQVAEDATWKILQILNVPNLRPLSRFCPGLKEFDWRNYLQCSKVRIVKVLNTIVSECWFDGKTYTIPLKILDFGAWLGNFSLAVKQYNLELFDVTAVDCWMRYSPCLDAHKKYLNDVGVDTIDTAIIRGRPAGPRYHIILMLGVIEHLSDTPRPLLRTLYDSLVPGGYFILDTPNLAAIANRRALNRGESPYAPIRDQFYSDIPFEGHVREYTATELEWMLEQIGFQVQQTKFFSYAGYPFWQSPLAKIKIWARPDLDELIYVVAQKPKVPEQ